MAFTPTRGQFSGQTFRTYRAYRDALAQSHGFGSLSTQQRASKPITAHEAYSVLKPKERASYRRSLDALNLLRTGQASNMAEAASMANTTPNTVHRYAGTALTTEEHRITASKRDTLVRPMRVITTDGVLILPLESSRDAKLAARHASAMRLYLERGGRQRLAPFQGKSITVNGKQYVLATERTFIESLAIAGELDFDTLYEDVT
jgi:hypothetical protein